jgi:hypothetical protein
MPLPIIHGQTKKGLRAPFGAFFSFIARCLANGVSSVQYPAGCEESVLIGVVRLETVPSAEVQVVLE